MWYVGLWFLSSVCLAEDLPLVTEEDEEVRIEAQLEADREETTKFLDQNCGKDCQPASDQEVRRFFKKKLYSAKQEGPKTRYKKYRSRKIKNSTPSPASTDAGS